MASLLLYFLSILIFDMRYLSRRSAEAAFLPSQGRGKAVYSPPSQDFTCGIRPSMLLLHLVVLLLAFRRESFPVQYVVVIVDNVLPEVVYTSALHNAMYLVFRYHYNVTDTRLAEHVEKGTEDGLYISCVASCSGLWAIVMDAGTNFTSQVYELSPLFLHKEWIMEQWEKNYYISSLAGATNGSSLVVMSKDTHFSQQSYKVSESFPFKWISKKWKEGFHVTSMATAGSRWAVVMSRNSGVSSQVVELDFLYPSEGIHKRWDNGYRITATAATLDQAALILSVPRRRPGDETQETLRSSQFPCTHVKEKWAKNLYLSCLCYGRTVS